ncbi:MAG: FeoA family protein [Acidobacteriota bacterium]
MKRSQRLPALRSEKRQSFPGRRLVDLPRAARARILRVDLALAPQLAGFGLYPGVEIQLQQKRPGFVIRCDEAEIALETGLARGIWVQRMRSRNS